MEWAKAALLCVAGAIMASVLRPQRPEMALGLALAAGVSAAAILLPGLREAAQAVRALAMGGNGEAVGIMLKAAGIGLVSDFSAQLCRDAGETALAGRAEMAGRTAVAVLAAPLIVKSAEGISKLLSLSA